MNSLILRGILLKKLATSSTAKARMMSGMETPNPIPTGILLVLNDLHGRVTYTSTLTNSATGGIAVHCYYREETHSR
jgi:hypothetical protein